MPWLYEVFGQYTTLLYSILFYSTPIKDVLNVTITLSDFAEHKRLFTFDQAEDINLIKEVVISNSSLVMGATTVPRNGQGILYEQIVQG